MLIRHQLACSFCGKSAAEVSKLVAGPKVYICDACVATAARILSEPGDPNAQGLAQAPSAWRRVRRWFHYIVSKVWRLSQRSAKSDAFVPAYGRE